jgi:5,10-methylenetetrahydromethanopterin reductase
VSLPRLGIRLHGGMAPGACIELARAAERSGFSAIWFAENPFQRGVLPAVAACLVETAHVTVGIGVFNPYNRHPTLIAMEIAALDELAPGRTRLGIGSGIGPKIRSMGLDYDKPLGALRDALAIVRPLLRGETVTHRGRVFSADGVKLEFPAPTADYPVLMAAMGDQALRLAGEISDGLMISNMCPPGYTARAIALMRDGAAKVGRRAPPTVVQYVPCVARPDRAAARAAIKPTIGTMLAAYWAMYEPTPAVRAAMVADSAIPEPDFVAAIARLAAGTPATAALDDRFVDAYGIAGTAQDCEAAAARFGALGVTDLTLTFVGPQPVADMAYLGAALAGGVGM